jgi:hypothetical protein
MLDNHQWLAEHALTALLESFQSQEGPALHVQLENTR